MKRLTIFATKLDAEGNPCTIFHYEHEGEAFASICNGYVTIYEMDTHTLHNNIIKLSDYEDVSIYNY